MSDRAEDKCGGSVATDSRPAADNQPGETNIKVRFFSSECHDCCNHTDNKTPQFLRFFVTRKLGCTIKLSFPTVLYMCGVTNRKLKEKPPEWSFMDPAEEYKMGNKRRGLALIFNQERFFWRLGLPDRSGTNADRYNLEKRLLDLNFEVRSYDNYKLEEVLEKIAGAAEEDHSDADCFLLAFLSHGEDNHVYCHDGKISIQDITAMFKGDKCKDLAGKPKIFVIQACRGEKHDDPVTPADTVDSRVEVFVDASAVHTLPAGADFIMCYSVAEGYYSHRETINGSWYIQDLCEMLQQYGSSLEFTELLTLVNRKVSTRSVFRCRDPLAIGKKQIPCFASMLTKKLYFRPKK